MGLGRAELPTSRLSGVRSNHLSYRPALLDVSTSTRLDVQPLLPLPLGSLLGPEVVLVRLVELVVEVVVIVFVEILVVELVLVQLIIEVFVEFLVLFEFSELLVDLVAPALERPGGRRLAGLHCHLRLRFTANDGTYSSDRARFSLRASLRRSVAPSRRLRSRRDDGVTSISSSSSMYSSASSKVIWRGGSKIIISSAAVVRMFVSFFSFVAFTSRSPGRTCSAMIRPSYAGSPGCTNIVPRS